MVAELTKDEASREALEVLLFQLMELLKGPPVFLDLPEWRENVEDVMNKIKDLSEVAYENLEDLVVEAVRRVEVHVQDLDENTEPQQTERSAQEYFTQVGFVSSEINSLKSI